MQSNPHLPQGIFPFEGKGIESPFPLDAAPIHAVRAGATTRLVEA